MMLQHTFCHIPGIGLKREEQIWSQGILTWDDLLKNTDWPDKENNLLSSLSFSRIREYVEISIEKFLKSDLLYFYSSLPPSEVWRLYTFPGIRIGYLDIETTGLGRDSTITTIALYSGDRIFHYVEGENLDSFEKDVQNCEMLVTYNGKAFDLPFITRQLGIGFHQAHIDLRYVLADLGFKGGLKGCEKALGIDRGDLHGLDGYDAVLLWKEYLRTKNPYFLNTLLAYNIADTINLETLLIKACNLKTENISMFRIPPLSFRAQPEPPFSPSNEVVQQIQKMKGTK